MGTLKSIDILNTLITEIGDQLAVNTLRDKRYITARVEHEGESFLAITLPALDQWLLQSLSNESVVPIPSAFKKAPGTCLPALLQGFTRLIFNPMTGLLRSNVNTHAIKSFRQVVRLAAKKRSLPTPARVERSIREYIATDKDVSRADWKEEGILSSRLSATSNRLYSGTFSRVSNEIIRGALLPRHSNGTSANGVSRAGRWNLEDSTTRLEDSGFWYYTYHLPFGEMTGCSDFNLIEPEDELPTKVVVVPKTMKTPRVITVEPSYRMFAQQALFDSFYRAFESDELLNELLPLRRQEVNQEMARIGSLNGSLSTLDLSEASDRVSVEHVERLIVDQQVRDMVFACRAQRGQLPSGEVYYPAKYSSMGSALTFPLEAMLFLSVVIIGIEKARNCLVDREYIKNELIGQVAIYGDDIIIPADTTAEVIDALETYGLKVNVAKSFSKGNFRESCGADYFRGVDVSTTYQRTEATNDVKSASDFISTVKLQNRLFESGYLETAKWLERFILKGHALKGVTIPSMADDVPYLHLRSFDERLPRVKYDRDLHKQKVKCLRVKSTQVSEEIHGYGAFRKSFYNPSLDDSKHLDRFDRPFSVKIKVGWLSAA